MNNNEFIDHMQACAAMYRIMLNTLCCKKVYHPTTTDSFNSKCQIPVIFGTVIIE